MYASSDPAGIKGQGGKAGEPGAETILQPHSGFARIFLDTMFLNSKADDMHIKGLVEDGLSVPEPKAKAEYLNSKQAS
jgi:hypothetical protein